MIIYGSEPPTEAQGGLLARVAEVSFLAPRTLQIAFECFQRPRLGVFYLQVPAIYSERDPESADLRRLVLALAGDTPTDLNTDWLIGMLALISIEKGQGRHGRICEVAPYLEHNQRRRG